MGQIDKEKTRTELEAVSGRKGAGPLATPPEKLTSQNTEQRTKPKLKAQSQKHVLLYNFWLVRSEKHRKNKMLRGTSHFGKNK